MKDNQLFSYIDEEQKRQDDNIELIASENFTSPEVREACASILTNKYAEGYPNHRYYGGCFCVDKVEDLARDYLKKLFNAEHANVQPHSGSQANMAVYMSVLNIGDTVMGMDLSSGGHLTHGSPYSFSGKLYNFVAYGVSKETEMLDYDDIRKKALEVKPKMIVVGASAYPRSIDFKKFREIADEVGAYLMCDMAHIAGLVAAGLHMSPVPYCDFVTSTTHKTLRGPRGGIILCKEKYAKAIDKTVFPGIQGGPLMHIIAGKAQCFYEALQPEFIQYAAQIIKNCKALSNTLKQEGIRIVTGDTDNHLILIDTKHSIGVLGSEAEKILEEVNITCNKNAIPFDDEKPVYTSGLRLGTAAMTTKGFDEDDFVLVGKLIASVLKDPSNENKARVKREVSILTAKHPMKR